MTYEKILEIADKKPLTVKQHEKFFKPVVKDNSTILFDYSYEAITEANVFSHALGTKPYQHIWTLVDGDSGKEILLNGWRLCNRLAYVVCEVPWGDGSDNDSEVYIESKY